MPVVFATTLPDEWLTVDVIDVIDVGKVPSHRPTPDGIVLYSRGGAPFFRLNVFAGDSCFAFEETVEWGNSVVIGFGDHVHFVSITTREITSTNLEAYFGHLYPQSEFLLAASGQRMFRFCKDGSAEWRSEVIGVDGVVLNRVEEDVLYCEGEWDPPGGWRPFKLRLSNGREAGI